MVHVSARISGFLKIGAVLFCFMCLFFATYMASRYEHAKTEAEIQSHKRKELEEKYQELLQTHTVLIQEKDRLAHEAETLRAKNIGFEDWKHTIEEGTPARKTPANQQLMPEEKNVTAGIKEDSGTDQSSLSAVAEQTQMRKSSLGTQTGNAMPARIAE
ncbi:MAG: hypothetical protein B6D35_01530 [Candidatus Brocadia sp. UTAMX2]|jgi:hypothetical protein|nr:MAG: hypothetical protein B6D35_01530 [Candidatus Brocadia sp. UTAMX2]